MAAEEGSMMSLRGAAALVEHVAALIIRQSASVTLSRAGHVRRRCAPKSQPYAI